MKKKIFILMTMLSSNILLYAQSGTARSDINESIQNWIVPILGFILVCGTGLSVLTNMDGLRGKNGADSHDAWVKVGQHVVFVLIGITILYFVANKVSSINISI